MVLPRPFFVLATENPIEMEGTFPLPEAQLDRFLLKIAVPFPSLSELKDILDRTTGAATQRSSATATAAELTSLHRLTREILVATPVQDYALRLVVATHPEVAGAPEATKRFVRHGASPRGAQALILGAKARALLEGRANVAFEDIRAVALPALRHRVLLNFEADAEGVTSDSLVQRLFSEVPEVPGERGAEIPHPTAHPARA